jgi:hypothetical protein
MTTLTATKKFVNNQYRQTAVDLLHDAVVSVRSGFDAETRAMLSILGRTLYLLALGSIGVVFITGQPPLFLFPLALFLFFGSCLQWRQSSHLQARVEANETER